VVWQVGDRTDTLDLGGWLGGPVEIGTNSGDWTLSAAAGRRGFHGGGAGRADLHPHYSGLRSRLNAKPL
jgi:hypothetical protein